MVVERDGVVLADFNDCKIKGTAVRPMLKAFGTPTVLFKSHSFAQAYPNCYDFADPADAQLMTREDFLETFLDALRELRPTYAVPFASMVAFLHPESRQCNVYAVRPPEVAAAAAAADVAGHDADTCSWCRATRGARTSGFALEPNDYYEQAGPMDRAAGAERRLEDPAGRSGRAHDDADLPGIRAPFRRFPSIAAATDLAGAQATDGLRRAVRPCSGTGSSISEPARFDGARSPRSTTPASSASGKRSSPTRSRRMSWRSCTSRCASGSSSRPAACRPIFSSGDYCRSASSATSPSTRC